MTIPIQKSNSVFKYYSLITAISVTCMIVSILLPYKIWQFGFFKLPGGALLFPLSYFFDDIVAEVYGYKLARQLIWVKILSVFLFCSSVAIIIRLPSPDTWQLQGPYNIVLGKSLRLFLGFATGMLVSDFVNTWMVSKWKILTNGKYFWLRTIGAAAIGEALFSIITGIIIYHNTLSLHDYFILTASVWLFKIGYAVLVSYPGSLFVMFLKNAEGVDMYDYHTDFNPFRLDVAYDEASISMRPSNL